MNDSFLNEFPIPAARLPLNLRRLLEPVAEDAQLKVEVTSRYEFDKFGPNYEYVQMVMVLAPNADRPTLSILRDAEAGVISHSTPNVFKQGDKARFEPSVFGADYDYVVASWGNGSYFSFHLAEKVWMALGLSPRCVGGDEQRIFYDDLSLPEFAVAQGEISTEYYWTQKRNVRWTILNAFLRRYLWMRGAFGVRAFFYEALLADTPELRSLMAGNAFIRIGSEADWYDLVLEEHKNALLVQVSAAVPAVAPELCPELSAKSLVWPGTSPEMAHGRANALTDFKPIYLDDRFLERYEQNSHFEATPVKCYPSWCCSPSYRGRWSFPDCTRVGRNIIRVRRRELYQMIPDREILHAFAHSLDPCRIGEHDLHEEHIVSKTARFVDQLLNFGDQLAGLSNALGRPQTTLGIVKISRDELHANGWRNYPDLIRMAQVAPIAMTEQSFLSRCKSIYEFWQRIPNSTLRDLISDAGHDRTKFKDFGSIRLLQAFLNIVMRLNASGESVDAFGAGAEPSDLTDRNTSLTPIFVNYDLRIADAHNAGGVQRCLEQSGFDVAELKNGYGRALDHVFDGVIDAFSCLNLELAKLRSR